MKLSNKEQPEDIEEPKLDASFVNVYKGAHGVIFIFDMTNRNSYSYVEEQLSKVNILLLLFIYGVIIICDINCLLCVINCYLCMLLYFLFDITNINSYSNFEEQLSNVKKTSCL